ncbi:MAG: hypothetical protein J7513_09340 [Solirubrobacteraceae bacterium]|nr:hypothetical protein [Solirubrobacteraceae bacterium]
MTAAATLPDPASLRARARELSVIASAAERAAARFSARALAGARDEDAATISGALSRIARAHRLAVQSINGFAGHLEDAAQRRLALRQLVDATRAAPRADRAVVAHVQELCGELVTQLDREVDEAAQRYAEALRAATPRTAEADEVAEAVALALDHASARLLQLAGSDPDPAP